MRRIALLVAAALLIGGVVAPAGGAATGKKVPAKAKVRCHWVKATKHRKRHRVCVKVKAKRKRSTTAAKAPAVPVPVPVVAPPAVPVAPAPVEPAPTPSLVPEAPTPAPEPAAAPVPAPAPARLQVTTREWSLALSRATLVAGPAIVELVNRGEDPHDLHVRPAGGGADVLSVAETAPGGVVSASTTLAAGSYTIYCALPGHEAAGMTAALSVG